MKKYLLLFILGICTFIPASAQNVQWYKATEFAIRYVNDYGNWTDWSDWEKVNILVKLDLSSDILTIYSKETQRYKVIYQEENPEDSRGKQVKFRVVDQEGDYGHVRFRIENNGNSQIYVDFADVSWVYNVKRTS